MNETKLNMNPDPADTFRLYIFDGDAYHGRYFSKKKDTDEFAAVVAFTLCTLAVQEGSEVRVTDSNDALVCHYKDRKPLFQGDSFWKQIGVWVR